MTPERWRQVDGLFQAVSALPSSERILFLERACAGDVALREQVEHLLADDAEGSGFLKSPAIEVAARALAANHVQLPAGSRIGPYEIESLLGAGGMGEVYSAHDPRLNRTVAVKVLPAIAAGDAERRKRLLREARAVAALNHPNIVSVFDTGSEDGVVFIVSELVKGESLRQRISRGHIPVRELLQIAVQIADGMAAAHSAGFVHRDLKPENIMLTPEGRVKILDFGLARQMAATAPESTVTQDLTPPGAIFGTSSYMSPEQARGFEAGPQSDQFSFGLILYELATGNRAFRRASTPQTLTAILLEEPPPIKAKFPAPLRWTIDRCLAKDPKARYDSTRDLYQDLRKQQEHFPELLSASVETAAAPVRFRRLGRWMYGSIPVMSLLAGVSAASLLLAPRHHGLENYRYTPFEISREHPGLPIWSPDGTAFSYPAVADGKLQVFVRYLDSPAASQITHATDGARPLGWSPDSKRLFILGKNPQGPDPPEALFSLSITGGEPEFVMPLARRHERDDDAGTAASISQNGKMLTVVRRGKDQTYFVATSSPVGAPLTRYSPAPFERKHQPNFPNLALSPDGSRILYFLNSGDREESWSLPMPPGSGIPKMTRIDSAHYGGTPSFSWFPDSRHVAIALQQQDESTRHLWIADTVTGNRAPLTTGPFDESLPAVSPNGKQILYLETTRQYRLVSLSLTDASVSTLISSQRHISMPAWARKVEKFVYESERNGEPEIWLHDADGSERQLVSRAMFPSGTTRWWMNPALSPAGDRLAYSRTTTGGDTLASIWISSLAGGPPARLTNSNEPEIGGSWSPDGGWFAYVQPTKAGITSIMISKTTGQAAPVQLRSHVYVTLPEWSPTGEWITFQDDSGWNLVSPDGKSTRALGKIATPHLTFSEDGRTLYGIRAEKDGQYLFSMSLDGTRIKTLGKVEGEFQPRSQLQPGIRFSLSPDGKSIVYPSFTSNQSLWMLEGFDRP